ncbi:protein trapped in endoderm-1-like [Patiria miniata]|uniref:G-protein coupled receptors family 1 profile domain-containing protein n=1 Tax=Patiria miniata TaxID=46514 RepID=A0A913YZR2_PATMI|nr:protein trapped in endoderm-1-like [Patiria miniata]
MNNTTSSPVVESEPEILVFEHFYERQIFAAIVITVFILGTIGNSFVIVAVGLSKKLRTTTNVFVVNLAVADLLTCFVLPWQAVAVLGGDDWPIPRAPWVCTATAFVILVTIGCSMNNLALIAVNRWVGITKSRFTTRRIYTARKLALMVIFSWAIPLVCGLTPVMTDFGELGFEKLYKSCTWLLSNPYTRTHSLVTAGIYYPTQLIVITVSYISIFNYVRKTSQETMISTQGNEATRIRIFKRQLDVTKNLVLVVLAFIICFTPRFVSFIISPKWIYKFEIWSATILFSNSSVNPIIYATSHPDFKQLIGHLIRYRQTPQDDPSQRIRAAEYTISASTNQECQEHEDHRM